MNEVPHFALQVFRPPQFEYIVALQNTSGDSLVRHCWTIE